MSPRKPNMLDAFQRSARADREAQARAAQAPKGRESAPVEPAPKPPKPPKAKKPGKPKAAAPLPVALRGQSDLESVRDEILGTGPHSSRPRTSLLASLPEIPTWIPAAVVILALAMLGTWWIGGLIGGESRAGEPEGDPPVDRFEHDLAGGATTPPGETPTPPPAEPESSGMTEDDRRFLDPNRSTYTVRAIFYDNDDEGGDRAFAAYHYLRNAGLPAVRPIRKSEHVVLCVGAEPSCTGKLEQIRDRLRSLPGPPPLSEAGAFSSAFFVNIDKQVTR